jgi:hypothetical protein
VRERTGEALDRRRHRHACHVVHLRRSRIIEPVAPPRDGGRHERARRRSILGVRLLVIDADGSRREYLWARRLNAAGRDVPYWLVLLIGFAVALTVSAGT